MKCANTLSHCFQTIAHNQKRVSANAIDRYDAKFYCFPARCALERLSDGWLINSADEKNHHPEYV